LQYYGVFCNILMVSNNLWEYNTAFHNQLNAVSIHQNVACIKLFVSQDKTWLWIWLFDTKFNGKKYRPYSFYSTWNKQNIRRDLKAWIHLVNYPLIFTGRENHYSGVGTVSYFEARNTTNYDKSYLRKSCKDRSRHLRSVDYI